MFSPLYRQFYMASLQWLTSPCQIRDPARQSNIGGTHPCRTHIARVVEGGWPYPLQMGPRVFSFKKAPTSSS